MKTHLSLAGALVTLILMAACVDSTPPPSPDAAETGPTQPPAESPTTPPEPPPADLPWWNERVFYEVFVRSFYDSSGDGIGDLRGLIQKLDYLNDGDPQTASDLGVTGLWLMPVMESPSYHGYDVIDYQKIQPAYGTNEDFKELVQQAHQRGIAVIIDMPLNHTSDQHAWFVQAGQPDSPYRDWYIWSEADPRYVGPWNQRVWHPLNGGYYYGIFASSMPDLNYHNPDVTAAVQDVSRFWLTEMGVDGFRLDAARHFIEAGEKQASTPETHAWLGGYHDFLDSINPDALLVGEVWSTSMEVAPYVDNGELDLTFEFELASAVLHALQDGDAGYLRSVQQQILDLYPPGQYAAFLSNHDQNRVMSELGGDGQKARVAAVLLLTNPGVPFIYYGEEIGMTGQKPDEHIRTPLAWDGQALTGGFTSGVPWEALSPEYEQANVQTESNNSGSLLDTYRRLIEIRRTHPAFQSGSMRLVDSSSKALYAYLRTSADETLLVLVNLSDQPVTDYALALPAGPLIGGSSAKWVWGSGDLAQPVVNAGGGFDGYQPLAAVESLSAVIIRLAP